jgi:transposase
MRYKLLYKERNRDLEKIRYRCSSCDELFDHDKIVDHLLDDEYKIEFKEKLPDDYRHITNNMLQHGYKLDDEYIDYNKFILKIHRIVRDNTKIKRTVMCNINTCRAEFVSMKLLNIHKKSTHSY